MVFFEPPEDPFHYGLADQRRTGTYFEAAAIFIDGLELLVIEQDRLPVDAEHRLALFVEVRRVNSLNLIVFALAHSNHKYNE